ncbi:transcriptional regulator [Bacillus inaquosorum]|uniref:transcriptional regulator n=1 Tax=Bacillus inaquosorum TaxID=483913 RepID=UPI0022817E8E|nr:transcriptional regulator [Bacillus inaquosorum]MCY7901452.1 transcriptional regulator [Bacillus inaquosorum]MCY8054623.1 transcriptional regulator [Bacillus inaquosorum]MCY8262214.1 transcriptional regulator [Bacillus inaquosorum]MCY8284040.1 transcriptional regulator [Bacillus inaquosorum]MCY9408061.1 transcriptional regulator [Bacillus inaquosorum]
MYTLQEISKPKRKKLVKNIEKHLKNYNNYKVAILNLSKQLEFIATNDNLEIFKESVDDDCEFQESVDKLASELQHIKLLKDSIDISLSELTELEYRFVQYRYFKNWTIEKSALEIGYSDKALFVIRNQVMDKLLISLGSVVYM